MKPVMLVEGKEKERVRLALERFYKERPPVYDMGVRRDQAIYEEYATLISRFTAEGGKVLDLGSATWRLPLTIHKRGFDVVGCDFFSEEALKAFKRYLPDRGVRMISYDGHSLPFPDDSFDTISSLDVMEHIVQVEEILEEIDRTLKPGGLIIIRGPNWSGPNIAIRAMQSLLIQRKRFWQYERLWDASLGLFRCLIWYMDLLLGAKPRFLHIYPRMNDGRIDFESSDDDAVHLNHPLSYKKWFRSKGYKLLCYNRMQGESRFARLFNTFFPSMATTNTIVAQKPAK